MSLQWRKHLDLNKEKAAKLLLMSLADYSSFYIFYTSNWFFKTLFGYKILWHTVILVYYTHVLYGLVRKSCGKARGHRVGRVLKKRSFFSSRRNWDSPNPLTRRRVSPPPGSGGRGSLTGERGIVWVPIPTYTVVLFIYSVRTLCKGITNGCTLNDLRGILKIFTSIREAKLAIFCIQY